MIKATRFHHEYLKQINRVNTAFNKTVDVATRDSYFNHGMEVVLENFFAISEINTTVRNHLRLLEKKKVKFKLFKETEGYCIYKYPSDFYKLLRQTAIMCTDTCTEPREILVRTIQSDDIAESIKDPYWEPSFEWEETFGDEGAEGYYVYKKKEHKIKELIVDYMRKPGDIAAPSLLDCEPACYVNAGGESICSDKDFEIDSTFLWRKIVDVAVLYTLRDFGQLDDFDGKMREILFVDKLYLK